MKKIYLIPLFFLFQQSYAQLLEAKIDNEILDSVYYFESDQNDYVLTDKYYITARNENGHPINALQYRYDPIQNEWQNRYLDSIRYYPDFTKKEYVRKYWDVDNNIWVDCEYSKWNEAGKLVDTYSIFRIHGIPNATYGNRAISIYDDNGNLKEHIEKVCDTHLNWSISSTQEYQYDELNRLKTYIFDSITKWEYLYNEFHQNDEIFISLLNSNQKWDTSWYHVLSYSNDSLIEDLTYRYGTSDKVSRNTYVYDFENRIRLKNFDDWDTIAQNWHTSVILKHKYNIDNQLLEYAHMDRFSGYWNFFRIIYDYDEKGNLVENRRQSGDSSNILDEWRYSYVYNNFNNLHEKEFQTFDDDNHMWINETKQIFYYSIIQDVYESKTDKNYLKIFPNPSRDIINIQGDPNMKITVIIYDLTGKLLISDEFIGNSFIIDMSDFQDGLYMLQLKSMKGIDKQLIIKD